MIEVADHSRGRAVRQTPGEGVEIEGFPGVTRLLSRNDRKEVRRGHLANVASPQHESGTPRCFVRGSAGKPGSGCNGNVRFGVPVVPLGRSARFLLMCTTSATEAVPISKLITSKGIFPPEN